MSSWSASMSEVMRATSRPVFSRSKKSSDSAIRWRNTRSRSDRRNARRSGSPSRSPARPSTSPSTATHEVRDRRRGSAPRRRWLDEPVVDAVAARAPGRRAGTRSADEHERPRRRSAAVRPQHPRTAGAAPTCASSRRAATPRRRVGVDHPAPHGAPSVASSPAPTAVAPEPRRRPRRASAAREHLAVLVATSRAARRGSPPRPRARRRAARPGRRARSSRGGGR